MQFPADLSPESGANLVRSWLVRAKENDTLSGEMVVCLRGGGWYG